VATSRRRSYARYPPTPRRLQRRDLEPTITPQNWPPTPATSREDARRDIQRLRSQYVATENPLYAWQALKRLNEDSSRGLPLPRWVRDYLRAVCLNLLALRMKPPTKGEIAPAVCEAVGFVPGGVNYALWKNSAPRSRETGLIPTSLIPDRFRRREKAGAFNPFAPSAQFNYAVSVFDQLTNGTTKLTAAYTIAAQQHGVSARSVQRAWMKYRQQFPARDTK
jgi:hypothetical protein